MASTLGRWTLERLLGRGGMGSVYRATDPSTGEQAALKTLRIGSNPADIASLRREILALSRIDHPGIVPVLDQGEDAGVPWYAMELVEGPPWRRPWPRPTPPTDRRPTPRPSSRAPPGTR